VLDSGSRAQCSASWRKPSRGDMVMKGRSFFRRTASARRLATGGATLIATRPIPARVQRAQNDGRAGHAPQPPHRRRRAQRLCTTRTTARSMGKQSPAARVRGGSIRTPSVGARPSQSRRQGHPDRLVSQVDHGHPRAVGVGAPYPGVNPVSGDFPPARRACAIDGGARRTAVPELTIASTLQRMLQEVARGRCRTCRGCRCRPRASPTRHGGRSPSADS